MTDLRSHGSYSDPLIVLENLSGSVDAVRGRAFYVHRCEDFVELVMEIQAIDLASREGKIFLA